MSEESTNELKSQQMSDPNEALPSGENVEFTRFSSLNVQISVERPSSHDSSQDSISSSSGGAATKPKIPNISRLGTPSSASSLTRPMIHREKSADLNEDAKFNGTGSTLVLGSPDSKKSQESAQVEDSASKSPPIAAGGSPSKIGGLERSASKSPGKSSKGGHVTKLSLDFENFDINSENDNKDTQVSAETEEKYTVGQSETATSSETSAPPANTNGTESEEPLEPEPFLIPLDKDRKLPQVKNTFFGGVRYFTSNEELDPLSDSEESPFEPDKPRFFTIRGGRRHVWQDDSGERPYTMFGDIEDRIAETELEPERDEIRLAIENRNRLDRQYFKGGAFDPEVNQDDQSETADRMSDGRPGSRGSGNQYAPYNSARGRGPSGRGGATYRGVTASGQQRRTGGSGGSSSRMTTTTLTMSSKGGIATIGQQRKPQQQQKDIARFTIQPEDFKRRRPRIRLDDMDAVDDKKSSTYRQSQQQQQRSRSRYLPESGSDYSDDGMMVDAEEAGYAYDPYEDDEYQRQRRPANLRQQPKQKRRRYADDDDDYMPSSAGPRGAQNQPVSKSRQPAANSYPARPRQGQAPRQVLRPKPPPQLAAEAPAQKQEQQQTVLLIKPYQQVNRSIFADMKFVLTSATRNKDASSLEEDAPPMMPFVKRQVRQMIEERGGIVVEDFAQLSDLSNSYLVADQYYRTHKYLSALVRAVPCVSHMWIFECAKENRLLHPTIFMLPAGRTLETNQIIKWHDKCPTLLSSMKVYVHTENKPENKNTLDFVQIWTPIAKLMGATIVQDLPDSTEHAGFTLDILLTDTTCPIELVQKTEALGAKAVSSEWLIQGIIAGHLPEYYAHPKYRYDYVELSAHTHDINLPAAANVSISSSGIMPHQYQQHQQKQTPSTAPYYAPIQPKLAPHTTFSIDYPRLEAQKSSAMTSSHILRQQSLQRPGGKLITLSPSMTSPALSTSTVMTASIQNPPTGGASGVAAFQEDASVIYEGATLANQDASLLIATGSEIVTSGQQQLMTTEDGQTAVVLSQEEAIQLLLSQENGATFATTEDGTAILIGQDEHGNPVIINQEDLAGATVIDADNLAEFQLQTADDGQLQQLQEQQQQLQVQPDQQQQVEDQFQQQQPVLVVSQQSQEHQPQVTPVQQEPQLQIDEQQQQIQQQAQETADQQEQAAAVVEADVGEAEDPNGNVIMISPEDLQLLVQEGVQIISQDGLIIIKQEDGTETVVGSADGTQFQIVTAAEGEELGVQEQQIQ